MTVLSIALPPEPVRDASGGMSFIGGVPIRITGSAHSDPFNHGDIEAGLTALFAYREFGRSTLTGNEFEVRRGDYEAVVLSLCNENVYSTEMTSEQRRANHGGYIGFGTVERAAIVELMDDRDVGPHIKIICIYTSLSVGGWMRKGGRPSRWLPGTAYFLWKITRWPSWRLRLICVSKL